MGKNKLKKFAEMDTLPNVFQFPFATIENNSCPLKGLWNEQYFGNNNPIVLELGCGKGEYTVGLAKIFPDKNYIGIDIKGARMWTGAKQAHIEGIANAAFLRTSIELIDRFFSPGEVSEIWITFPDPQMKKVRKRLVSTRFLELYRKILVDNGIIHLKTDSPFLYSYTDALTKHNNLVVTANTPDLYNSPLANNTMGIKTHYEKQWLDRGLTIKYISFLLDHNSPLTEPDVDIEPDTYRSYSRGYLQCPQLLTSENSNSNQP